MGRQLKQSGIVDLAAFRESRGVSLQQVAGVTRISMRYLQAIERAEFKKLPGGVYDVSYIRQYAGEIGLDPSVLLDFYRAQMPREEPPEERPAKSGFFHGLLSFRRAS
jgi:cytoskeletal protein RodZ